MKPRRPAGACGAFQWGEGLVLGLRIEAGLVALAALLADALEHGATYHGAHDGADDRAGRAGVIKAAGGSKPPETMMPTSQTAHNAQ